MYVSFIYLLICSYSNCLAAIKAGQWSSVKTIITKCLLLHLFLAFISFSHCSCLVEWVKICRCRGEMYSLQFLFIHRCWLGTAGCQGRQEDHLLWIGGSQHPSSPTDHTSKAVMLYKLCINVWKARYSPPCPLNIQQLSVLSLEKTSGEINWCFQAQM